MATRRAVGILASAVLVLGTFTANAFAEDGDGAGSPPATGVAQEAVLELETAATDLQTAVAALEGAGNDATAVAQAQSQLAVVKALADGLASDGAGADVDGARAERSS